MEHWTYLANSNAAVYAAVFVFTLGLIIWLVWARFFPESSALRKVSHFVMTLAGLIFFAGGYVHVVARGLDGVACAAGRYSGHAVCFARDESPVGFWGLVSVLTVFDVALMLAAVACMTLVFPRAERRVIESKRVRRPAIRGDDQKSTPGGAGRLPVFQVLGGAGVVLPLAWMVASFHQADGARRQVDEALASVAADKAAVENYLRDHGALPEDNRALGLPSPADLRGPHTSRIEISDGHIMLKFDDASADEHLRDRWVMLIAVRRGSGVAWHCASPDIDDKYLPRSCRIYR
jgi:type IV pilus assembly protein PilA